jgi:hypothetical protein
MKKLSLFLLGCFATSYMAFAQCNITADMFTAPANTGANMTVGVNASKFDQFEGGQIGAFIDLDEDGTLECVGLESVQIGFFGLALWGDDSSTPNIDGLLAAAAPSFAILHNGNVILVAEIPQFTGYVTNGIVNITDASLTGCEAGCTDASACNTMVMYGEVAYTDDGSCAAPAAGLDCDGNCLNDADGDLICDGNEVVGCQDEAACNFNADATDAGDCSYATGCDTCSGETDGSGTVVDNDADNDGVCDADEVVGCQDASACNYNWAATDSGACNYPVGCDSCSGETDGSGTVVFNDDDGDGICNADEVLGCMNPAACNFNPSATDATSEVGAGCDDELNCYIDGVNVTCTADAANTSIAITSNNMSVLFPVNNTGIWNADVSNMEEGDILASVYETARLENEFLGYSAISGLQNGGSLCDWDGDQQGLAIFGADNGLINGFQPGEDLKWIVKRASDGKVYNATVSYATSGYGGAYEENSYVTANSVVVGSLAEEGCTNSNFMEFNPMALTDDGSCATYISVGCMDANAVNYAGADVDADNIHDNATNHDNPFGDNLTVDLNSGLTSPSGAGAIFHDISMCQTQVEGCTDPMAHNYDPLATQNDDTDCDWSLNGMVEYDVDHDGNVLGSDYDFGSVDPANENDGIVGSDFDHAQLLFEEGALDPTGHVIDNLADVMEWIEMDEARDAQELADTISDMQDRYDANDAAWDAAYQANDEFLRDSISNTLDSAAVAFAADEAADLEFLNNTIAWWTAKLDSTEVSDDAILAQTISDADALLAATIAAADALLAQTISDMQDAYDANDAQWAADYAANDAAHIALEGLITDSLDYHRAPIIIDLHTGWNTVAYYLHHESPVVAQFEAQFGSEEDVQDNINIVKNNEGLFYWPDFLFDGLGMLQPGQGYQVRVKDATSGNPNFFFDHAINRDDYRVLTPSVPSWAIEMDVENHPNDVRTLVRVINMLGQEVVPAEQFAGEVLLYMYNDGTVEKKMVE